MKTNALLLLLMAGALAACGKNQPAPAAPAVEAAPAVVAAPVAAPVSAPVVAASAADLAIGEKIYGANCVACHGAAVMGAPKLADKPSWTPRIAKGVEVLYTSAINGVKMMPPRGGNAALKDDEVKAAVDFMVSKAL